MLEGTAGLAFAHKPHIRDVFEIIVPIWESLPRECIRNCWIKACALPEMLQSELSLQSVKYTKRGRYEQGL